MTQTQKLRLAALIGFAIHLGVMLYQSPPSVILGDKPMLTLDWATHYEQCRRAVEAFDHHRRMWNWDPHLLAGMPSGTIFDADNKFFEVWCVALTRLGVPFDRAYNLFAWFVSGLIWPVVWASSRLFGVTPRGSILAAALASSIWWFDGFAHWEWFVGMLCWAMAAYLWLLPLALLVAYVRERRAWTLVALAPVLALAHTLHPYTFLVLVTPMLVVYGRALRQKTLSGKEHAAILGVAAFTVLANLWWLKVALRFWHYILDSGYYLDATPDYVLWDWLALVKEPWTTGVVANRTAFRFLVVGLAAVALWVMRRRKDERWPWVWPALAVAFFIAYVGGATPLLRQVQPYRFVLPGLMMLAVLAGAALDELIAPLRALFADRAQRAAAAAFGVLALVCAPRLLRDVLYFTPDLVPRMQKALPLPPPNVNSVVELGTLRWPEPFSFRHGVDAQEPAIEAYVKQLDDGGGRFLIQWSMTGEQLAGRTDAQVLGGFLEINLAHSDANWFRVHPATEPPDPEAFRAYLERYNVKWISLVNRYPKLEARRDILEPMVSPPGGRWFRSVVGGGWLVGGGPALVRAQSDKLEVRGTQGGSMVLKYHYLETLKCSAPGCTLRRAEVPGDRVGFIGVDGAPSDFDIVNAP
jgi:hypothetical protein